MRQLLRKLLFLPPEASSVAGGLDSLTIFLAVVTLLGAIGVIGSGTYFIIRYRRRAQAGAAGQPERGAPAAGKELSLPPAVTKQKGIPLGVELFIVFSLLGLFVMWWFIGFRQYVQLRTPPANAMEVYVTGKQWMWEFDYPEGPRTMTTLVVPAGRPVKLLMTSRDVIHGFYVPDFRIKQDVLPGRYTVTWFQANAPGRYPILCTQYCGTGHSEMRGEVLVLAPEEFDRWLGGEAELAPGVQAPPVTVSGGEPAAPTETNLAKVGAKVAADRGCLRCHTVDGTPHLGPTWAGLYDSEVPLEGGTEIKADEAYLTESMMDPNLRLHRGFPAIMPTYQGVLTPQDTAALVEYIKSLRDVPAAPKVPQDPEAAARGAAASQPATGTAPTPQPQQTPAQPQQAPAPPWRAPAQPQQAPAQPPSTRPAGRSSAPPAAPPGGGR